MTTQTIDADQAIALLEAVVAEKGEDFEYVMPVNSLACKYFDRAEKAPSCGVGVALFGAGLTLENLDTLDGYGSFGSVWRSNNKPLISFGVEVTPEAAHAFDAFQYAQDRSLPYGIALENAKESLAVDPDDFMDNKPGRFRLFIDLEGRYERVPSFGGPGENFVPVNGKAE